MSGEEEVELRIKKGETERNRDKSLSWNENRHDIGIKLLKNQRDSITYGGKYSERYRDSFKKTAGEKNRISEILRRLENEFSCLRKNSGEEKKDRNRVSLNCSESDSQSELHSKFTLDTKSDIDSSSSNSKSGDFKVVTESADCKSIDYSSVDSRHFDTKSIDSKSVDSKSVGSKSIDSKITNTKSLDSQSKDFKIESDTTSEKSFKSETDCKIRKYPGLDTKSDKRDIKTISTDTIKPKFPKTDKDTKSVDFPLDSDWNSTTPLKNSDKMDIKYKKIDNLQYSEIDDLKYKQIDDLKHKEINRSPDKNVENHERNEILSTDNFGKGRTLKIAEYFNGHQNNTSPKLGHSSPKQQLRNFDASKNINAEVSTRKPDTSSPNFEIKMEKISKTLEIPSKGNVKVSMSYSPRESPNFAKKNLSVIEARNENSRSREQSGSPENHTNEISQVNQSEIKTQTKQRSGSPRLKELKMPLLQRSFKFMQKSNSKRSPSPNPKKSPLTSPRSVVPTDKTAKKSPVSHQQQTVDVNKDLNIKPNCKRSPSPRSTRLTETSSKFDEVTVKKSSVGSQRQNIDLNIDLNIKSNSKKSPSLNKTKLTLASPRSITLTDTAPKFDNETTNTSSAARQRQNVDLNIDLNIKLGDVDTLDSLSQVENYISRCEKEQKLSKNLEKFDDILKKVKNPKATENNNLQKEASQEIKKPVRLEHILEPLKSFDQVEDFLKPGVSDMQAETSADPFDRKDKSRRSTSGVENQPAKPDKGKILSRTASDAQDRPVVGIKRSDRVAVKKRVERLDIKVTLNLFSQLLF